MFSCSVLSRILVLGRKLYIKRCLYREVWGHAPQEKIWGVRSYDTDSDAVKR